MITTLVCAFVWLIWQEASIIITSWIAVSRKVCKPITGKSTRLKSKMLQLKWMEIMSAHISFPRKVLCNGNMP